MRIVVSGTHASGKSTLISGVRMRHPHLVLLDDPYDALDETSGADESGFARQLRIAASRLSEADDEHVATLPDAPRFVTLTGDRSARTDALDELIRD